ncbi:MAG: 16S rRNA (guanine(527)-N(7))-methyltransferase RsmG [Coriobacteriia bacterium]|nr:16S rRNA (guanine(527)-N(7))-methyltransferase RsmG [Coriobacteriia bacterium]
MSFTQYLPKDFPITEDQIALLDRHLAYVLQANEKVRLTAIKSQEDGERLHVADSLYGLPEVLDAPPGMLLDMGTGGGYPGIPLGLLSGRKTVLLDAVSKKCRMLDLYLESEPALHGHSTSDLRAEELAMCEGKRYSAVTARALSALPSLVELASPLLSRGGRFVAYKGALCEEELVSGDSVAAYTGMRRISVRRYVLPDGNERRAIVVYEKFADSKTKLPRRPGMAQRRPFA